MDRLSTIAVLVVQLIKLVYSIWLEIKRGNMPSEKPRTMSVTDK